MNSPSEIGPARKILSSPRLSLSRADKFLQDYPVVLRKIVRGEEEPVRRNRGDGGNLKGSCLNRVKRVENWEKMRRSWTFFGGGYMDKYKSDRRF